MGKLPNLNSRKAVKLLKRYGFMELRQVGGHLHLYHEQQKLRVTIPMHNKDLKRKTLASILRQAKIRL